MGSVGKFIGAAVGGVGGFLLGGPLGAAAGASLGAGVAGSIERSQQETRAQNELQNRIGAIEAQEEAFIRRVRELSDLRKREALATPSVAEQATRLGIEQAFRQGQAAAIAQRGISPGLAAAIAARQSAQAGVDAIARGAVAQAEEAIQKRRLADEQEMRYEDMVRAVLAARRGALVGLADVQARRQAEADRGFYGMLSGVGAGLLGSVLGKYKGGLVPGNPKVDEDSPQNDFVHALLSPGELVVPRSVVKKGSKEVEKFARKILEKEGLR